MKHIKPYKIFENKEPQQHPGFPETEEEIHRLCKEYRISNYTINKDLSIDVEGDVKLEHKKLEYLPLSFNYVSERFDCSRNELTSLKGAPNTVGDIFYCYGNKLKSLEGGPHTVGGDFNCTSNKLISLKGSPHTVGGHFDCLRNKLKSLEGAPHTIRDYFSCSYNKLKSLEYYPSNISGGFYCDYNPIYTLIYTFIRKDNAEDLVQEFNDYNIVRGNDVVLNRLKAFVSDFDLTMPNLDEVRKHYKIV